MTYKAGTYSMNEGVMTYTTLDGETVEVDDDPFEGATFDVYRQGPKLNPEKVREIRSAYASGNVTLASLADAYSVTTSTISNVINGVTWKTVV